MGKGYSWKKGYYSIFLQIIWSPCHRIFGGPSPSYANIEKWLGWPWLLWGLFNSCEVGERWWLSLYVGKYGSISEILPVEGLMIPIIIMALRAAAVGVCTLELLVQLTLGICVTKGPHRVLINRVFIHLYVARNPALSDIFSLFTFWPFVWIFTVFVRGEYII